MNTTRCKVCPAEIIWARTANDKRIPLDAAPTMDGNVMLDANGIAHVLGPLDKMTMTIDSTTLHMPHHATCPNWGKG